MHVLEHQHQQLGRRDGFDRLDHFAQHALNAATGHLALQRGMLRVVEQPRQLQQPDRRMAPQQRDDVLPSGLPAQPAHRLEYRQVRFARAVLLDAFAARDARRRQLRKEGVDQRALADPRFAADEDELALSRRGAGERAVQPGQFRAAPDDWRRRLPRARRQRRRLARGNTALRAAAAQRNVADEAVAAATHRLDEARRQRIVGEQPAQLADELTHLPLLDDDAAPPGSQQLLLRQQLVRPLDQRAQKEERLGRQRDSALPPQQSLVRHVQLDARQRRLLRCGQYNISTARGRSTLYPPRNGHAQATVRPRRARGMRAVLAFVHRAMTERS